MRLVRYTLIVLLACSAVALAQEKKAVEFGHIFDDTFSPNDVENVRWMNDGEYYTATEENRIIRFSIVDGSEQVLFDGSQFSDSTHPEGITVEGYEFSASEQKILVKTDVEELWRRSTKENYYVYNRNTAKLAKLVNSPGKQQYATFSPGGNRVAFVRNNDLFWVNLDSGKETRVTSDGEFNKIINGAADWVYEEEFGFAKAFFWSPEGNRIAFYRFDEERVKQFFMTEWGSLYPGQTRFKYPKAGEKNSIVGIHVHHLDSGETVEMATGEQTDQYIPRISWTQDNNLLAIQRMNRLQNKKELLFANASTGNSSVILTEQSDTWIDVHDNLHFLRNGQQFITTSDKSGYNHICLYNMKGKQLEQITSGNWDVTGLFGYDERTYTLYYESAEESPLQRHLYKIRIDGNRKSKLTSGAGWHDVNMSRDFKYYIDEYSDYNKPPVVSLYRANGRKVRTVEANEELSSRLAEYAFSTKEFMKFDVNGASLNAYMMKPADFDSTRQYPVLMYVYGGPGSQTVTRSFSSGQRPMWHQYLTNRGYIIVSVDNRGTGARGAQFKKQTYKKLGQYETADQVAVAEKLAELPYVDEDRIGIWGWSYGGYMSSLVLAEGANIVSTAVAVAPVTHWKFYDTIYTERFMQTPQQNPEGYEEGSPLNKVDQIKGSYLLVHGTGDDNVHFQNSVEMVDALVENGVQFETMFYPGRAHSLSGDKTRKHLYRLMTNFILEKL